MTTKADDTCPICGQTRGTGYVSQNRVETVTVEVMEEHESITIKRYKQQKAIVNYLVPCSCNPHGQEIRISGF